MLNAQNTGLHKVKRPDTHIGYYTYEQIKAHLLEKKEIALVDVREEAVFAEGHPLFAANIPYSRVETDFFYRIPRPDTRIVIYDNGEGIAEKVVSVLLKLGYSDVNLLKGGLEGWIMAGGEIFRDVNSPSKAFGELVEVKRHTPSLSADEVKKLIDSQEDMVILDARRFDEYHTMNIPTSYSVPGGELVLRAKQLAHKPSTKIIVNCAGRTRSIIGAQSLINANITNPVFALRNGTIGWSLAGQTLEYGQSRRYSSDDQPGDPVALGESRLLAIRAGVGRVRLEILDRWVEEKDRTTYRFDVRSRTEYEAGHLPGFQFVPGGQLVQETDHYASVRGARIVLVDHLEVRANMTASWLAQMGWEVYVLAPVDVGLFTATEPVAVPLPPPDAAGQLQENLLEPVLLAKWLNEPLETVIVDFSLYDRYQRGHIPGAWYVIRSQLSQAIAHLPQADRFVLTSVDHVQAGYVFAEFRALTDKDVFVLRGGNRGWTVQGYPLEIGDAPERIHLVSQPIDRYRRPYEGTDNSVKAMQDYLEWEYGLVDQLERDGTHHFNVI